MLLRFSHCVLLQDSLCSNIIVFADLEYIVRVCPHTAVSWYYTFNGTNSTIANINASVITVANEWIDRVTNVTSMSVSVLLTGYELVATEGAYYCIDDNNEHILTINDDIGMKLFTNAPPF